MQINMHEQSRLGRCMLDTIAAECGVKQFASLLQWLGCAKSPAYDNE